MCSTMRKNAEKSSQVPKAAAGLKRSILYTGAEWSKLLSYLNEKQRREDLADTRRLELQERREASKKLKDSFVGSQEEQKMRQQLKRERVRYEKELQQMEEERKQENLKIVEQTRRALRRNKDGWKALDSALRLADTLRERKKQIEFQDRVRTMEAKVEKDWSDKVMRNAREFQEEKIKEREEKMLKKNENFQRTTQSLKQLQEERDRVRALEIEEEQREVDKVKQEIKDIEQAEKADKARTKQIIDELTRESFRLEAEKKQREEQEEELDRAAYHIIKDTTRQLTDMKSKVLQERHQAEMDKRARIHQHLSSLLREAADDEEARIRRDVEKADEKYRETLQAESEKRRRMARDKNENYEQFVRDAAEAERRESEKMKWELLKRCRMSEHDKALAERRREWEKEKKRNQRADLDTQMEELKLYAAEARKPDEEALKRSALLWKLDDEEVMKYGERVYQDCLDKDRPTLPVVKAIENYKKNNHMVPPRTKNLSQWESNVFPRPFQRKIRNPV